MRSTRSRLRTLVTHRTAPASRVRLFPELVAIADKPAGRHAATDAIEQWIARLRGVTPA